MNRAGLRQRFRLFAVTLATLMQLPAVSWLCVRAHSFLPLLLAVALSTPYLLRLRTPWHTESRPLSTFVALFWWAACFVFGCLLIPAWVLTRLGTPGDSAYIAAGVLALWSGYDSVRARPRVRRRTVRITNLPPALEGYRIGQISDIHCGPHTSAERVDQWVAQLNALDLDLIAVTGDLITSGPSYVAAVSRSLGGLRARDGVFACMGNHDYFTDGEHFVRELSDAGLEVLRNRGVTIERDGARLFVAGADDTWTSRHDVGQALADRPADVPAVLLAHDPNLFTDACAHHVDLTLSGHTHGGQLAVPGFRGLSLARFITRFPAGLYRRGRSWLYVNRGAGTTGPPVRIGAPAELAVLTLRG